jgi:hypothetical protein
MLPHMAHFEMENGTKNALTLQIVEAHHQLPFEIREAMGVLWSSVLLGEDVVHGVHVRTEIKS